VSALGCTPTRSPVTAKAKYQINVGTAEIGELASAKYIVDPSSGNKASWKYVPLPETSHRVIRITGAKSPSGPGVFMLYDRGDGVGCTQAVLNTKNQ
jgi:hypothetical protein